MPRLVHELDKENCRFVFQSHARVGIHVLQDLAQIGHLRPDGGWVRAHASLAEMPAESRIGRVSKGVRPVGPI